MSFWRLPKPHTGNGLLRQFATLSLIVIGLITVTLSLVISYYLRKDLLDREWWLAADFTRTAALYHLTPADFDAPMSKQAQEHFTRLYAQMLMMPEIVRVKIYDATMTVVWSDEPRLIGRRFPGNDELASALRGATTVSVETEPKGENVYEQQNSAGGLVEVYVPIVFSGTARVAGVVETYKLPGQVFANIRRGQLIVAATALAGGVVLYLSLFSIVRLVARRLESQRALTAHLQVEHEQERASIAHEAREQLAQVLSALKIDLSRMAANPPNDPEALQARTKGMVTLVDTAMKSALQIASDSRPGILDTLGLAAALDWEARRFQARTGIQCRFTSRFDGLDLDQEHRTVMFRFFQEALSNVARHSGATRVTVGLEKEAGRVLLTVEDNGRGITGQEIADPKSLGLLTMRESAHSLRGELLISGAPGKGTRVTLTIPLSCPESIAV
jgi:signal transduction histidine kinase